MILIMVLNPGGTEYDFGWIHTRQKQIFVHHYDLCKDTVRAEMSSSSPLLVHKERFYCTAARTSSRALTRVQGWSGGDSAVWSTEWPAEEARPTQTWLRSPWVPVKIKEAWEITEMNRVREWNNCLYFSPHPLIYTCSSGYNQPSSNQFFVL